MLPGLLPGLPPEPGTSPRAPAPTPEDLRRPAADRHKVLVDRRLLAAGGALAVVLIVVFGILAFAAGGDTKTAAAPAGPTPAAPGGAASAAPAGNPQDRLRAMLNPTALTDCTAPTRSDSAYADATLNCKASSGGNVSAFSFPNRSAVDRQIGAREAFYVDEGNCDDGQQSTERWTSPTDRVGGNRLCYFFARRFYEFWTYDDKLVAFSTDDPDAAQLNTWWHTFDPLRH
ncbi:hypothetical protein [Frankia sp. AgB32]|uniref:hypothetical protein n=1 Tax=Frankia sp. AgB32 TaxID=631119 RepID=UPI00200E75EE|nr:hypothetical protein [Frankia sp. AgB32]MCK9893843.1 hypothetical protein [Frankia sp. AgB32]